MSSVSTFIKQIISKNSILSNLFENNTNNNNNNNEYNYDIEEAKFRIHPINGELFYKTIFQTKNSYYIFNSINLSKENGEQHFIGVMDPETKTMMDYFYYKNGNDYYITASVDFKVVYREINPDIEDIKSMVRNIEKYYSSPLSCGTNKVYEGLYV